MLTDRQKKRKICGYLLCIVLLCGGLWWAAEMNGLHLSWEKAFYATEEGHGYGPSEKILLSYGEDMDGLAGMGPGSFFFSGSGTFQYVIGRMERTETEGMLSTVRLLKTFPLIWMEYGGEAYSFAGQAEAKYWFDGKVILGSCQNEEIKEVFLEWGYRKENGEWTYLHETTIPVEEDGFFWLDLSGSWKEMLLEGLYGYGTEGDILLEGIGVKYLEGRGEGGEVLYRKWMDDTGKLVETDPRG